MSEAPDLRFDERGLLPVIAQDVSDGAVLMLAYADREAVDLTLATGEGHYFSRSRGRLWRKGETSGNVQRVHEVLYDCDADSLLYRVEQTGPACHTGARSCFFRVLGAEPAAEAGAKPGAEGSAAGAKAGHDAGRVVASRVAPATATTHESSAIGGAMSLLEAVVAERLAKLPEGSYVTRLHERGLGYVAQKVVEEAGETIVAALEAKRSELKGEAADLLFHLGVLLAESGVSWDDVANTLLERHRVTQSDASAERGAQPREK